MKKILKFQREAMVRALKNLNRIAGTRATMPILNWAKLESSTDYVVISRLGCDNGSFTKVKIPATGTSDFGVLIHADQILKQIESLPEGEIFFNVSEADKAYALSSGKTVFSGELKPLGAYPELKIEGPLLDSGWDWKFHIDTDRNDFLEFMSFIMKACSVDTPINYSNAVLLEVRNGKRNIVSTDGRRIHYVPIPGEVKGKDRMYLVPAKYMKSVMEIDTHQKTLFWIVSKKGEKDYFNWSCGEYNGVTVLLDKPYPDFIKVFPEPGVKFKINPDQIINGLSSINVIASNPHLNNMVIIEIEDGKLKMSAKSESVGKVKTEIPCELIECAEDCEPKIRMGVGCVYMMDALKSSRSDEVTIEFRGSYEPVKFEYGDGCAWVSLVMPMRIPR